MSALAIREQKALRVVARTEEHLQVKLRLSCGCLAVVNVWDLASRRLGVDQAVAVLLGEHACELQTQKKPLPPEGESGK